MSQSQDNTPDVTGVPVSLQRKIKEPTKMIQFRIPLSWAEELTALAREYDQDVSTFLREATEDWLRRASKIRPREASEGDAKTGSL